MTESFPTRPYLFNDYSSYIRRTFGERVRKISINLGYSCPNRDGTKAYHGCSYCNVSSIQPSYATRSLTVSEQLEKGIQFFQVRGNARRFLAYFQSYTNTYRDFDIARKAYEEALSYPGVTGIVIGTRPDCISEDMASYLRRLATQHYVSLEIGIESTDDETLKRVNRYHTYADVVNCLESFRDSNIHLGGHLILSFPWESRETMLEHASRISSLPLQSLKLHHLQILKHTQLAREHQEDPFELMNFDSYFDLATEFVERTRPDLIFQRFLAEAPPQLLIAPHFNGIRNYEFVHLLQNRLSARKSSQGKLFGARLIAERK
jgi:uncharacterized protein